jgi:hypothetical protein
VAYSHLAEDEGGNLQDLAIQLFSHHKQYTTWRNTYDPDVPWREEPGMSIRLPKPLYYASLEGLKHVTNTLISKGRDVNAQGGHYGNALQAASRRGLRCVPMVFLSGTHLASLQ